MTIYNKLVQRFISSVSTYYKGNDYRCVYSYCDSQTQLKSWRAEVEGVRRRLS